MTPDEKMLYKRLYKFEISELEALKDLVDKIIFDKFLNNIIKEQE